MESKEITSVEKNKRKEARKPTRIQMIKFGIGIIIGISLYLIVKLIF